MLLVLAALPNFAVSGKSEGMTSTTEMQSALCPLDVCNFRPYTKAQVIAKFGNRNISKDGDVWSYDKSGYLNVGNDGQFDYSAILMQFSRNKLNRIVFIISDNTESEADQNSNEALKQFNIHRSFVEKDGIYYHKSGRGKVSIMNVVSHEGKYNWGISFQYLK